MDEKNTRGRVLEKTLQELQKRAISPEASAYHKILEQKYRKIERMKEVSSKDDVPWHAQFERRAEQISTDVVSRLYQYSFTPERWDTLDCAGKCDYLRGAAECMAQEMLLSHESRGNFRVVLSDSPASDAPLTFHGNDIFASSAFLEHCESTSALRIVYQELSMRSMEVKDSVKEIETELQARSFEHLYRDITPSSAEALHSGSVFISSSSGDIQKKLARAQENYRYHVKRYQQAVSDKANGWIGVDRAISDHKFGMELAQKDIRTLQRDLQRALDAEKKA